MLAFAFSLKRRQLLSDLSMRSWLHDCRLSALFPRPGCYPAMLPSSAPGTKYQTGRSRRILSCFHKNRGNIHKATPRNLALPFTVSAISGIVDTGAIARCTVCVHSWSWLAPSVESPETRATCQSSVPGPALTARPTFICMTGTPATMSRATATTVSARLMSSSASPCGGQVSRRPACHLLDLVHRECRVCDNIFVLLFRVCLYMQEQNRLLGFASSASTLQEIHMGIVEKIRKAPLPNAMRGKSEQLHREVAVQKKKKLIITPLINLGGVISNHHCVAGSDMWNLRTKVYTGEECNLGKMAANYFLESIHASFHAILVG